MAATELLKRLKGDDRSQVVWAEFLGVDQQRISDWLRTGAVGKEGLVRLLLAYPDHRDELLAEFDPNRERAAVS